MEPHQFPEDRRKYKRVMMLHHYILFQKSALCGSGVGLSNVPLHSKGPQVETRRPVHRTVTGSCSDSLRGRRC